MDLLGTHRRLARLPFGERLFSFGYQLAAPYFLTIPARLVLVEPGRAEARMWQAPWVRNHLGTVHAIALCNLAEYTMGAVAEASVPATHRWVPKGMSVEYLALARGAMHAVATLELPASDLGDGIELPVAVSVRDGGGTEVFTATIRIWVTARAASAR
jgi:acyl-coenzyme A thioesterase PaaI-like protein